MSSPETHDEDRRRERLDRRRRRSAAQQQMGIAIGVGGMVLVLIIIMVVVLSSRGPSETPEERAARLEAESKRLEEILPEKVPTLIRRRKTEEEIEEEKRRRLYGKGLSGDALREQIDKEYQAALRRSRIYQKRGQWQQAIDTIEQLTGRYDDEELRLRCHPEIDELLIQSKDAWEDAKRHAELLAKNHKYRDARQHLLDFVGTCGIEAYQEEARELGDTYIGKRAAWLEQQYREAIAPINAMLPEWKLAEALEEARQLAFDEAEYQEKLRRRVAELQALVDLQKKMIRRVTRASPLLTKRSIRAPGMAGDMTSASLEGFEAMREDGTEEKYTWDSIGPEAIMRLALLCGDQRDPQHRLAVARLLVEVGHLKRARIQLKAAQNLGADTAALEERLETVAAMMGEAG